MGLGKNGLAVFVFPGLVPGGLAQVSAHLLSQPQHFYLFSVKKKTPWFNRFKMWHCQNLAEFHSPAFTELEVRATLKTFFTIIARSLKLTLGSMYHALCSEMS